MNTKVLSVICARKMQIEYNKTRKDLAKRLKRRLTPDAVKSVINESFILLNDKLSTILTFHIAKAFVDGKNNAESELKGIVRAAAPLPPVSDPMLGRITHRNIGAIGKYNLTLNKTLQKEYDTLLSDNRLANSLKKDGWSPWMGETLKKRGIDPKVISLVKQQSTSAKMVSILNQQGIRGGLHPDQVGRRLEPYVNRYFGPKGVEIDNIGKTVKKLHVDADGNYKWVKHKVTRKYHATPRTYSRLLARNSMKQAHQDAYYNSLQSTNLVDHFISISILDARTCGDCAMMHGRTVLKGEGPQYHGNCHCDLKPVWKKDSLLGDKNKDDSYYANQRDKHFLAVNDLKRYNLQMPTGSRVKYYTMLPEGAKTAIIPRAGEMRAIRNNLLGNPLSLAPKVPKPKVKPTPAKDVTDPGWTMTDDEWRDEADKLWVKTKADGNEHLKLFNGKTKEFTGTENNVRYQVPNHPYSSMHTHPGLDAPLSPQDFASFLSGPNAKCEAAASNKAIYIIRKKPGYARLTFQDEAAKLARMYDKERKRLIAVSWKAKKFPDQTEMALKAGKLICDKYGLEYKVIKRKP